ncbi:MAG: hypothetical protein WCJ61_12335, partial [Paludibacter sp.]
MAMFAGLNLKAQTPENNAIMTETKVNCLTFEVTFLAAAAGKTNSELILNIVDFLESNTAIAYGKRIQGNFIDFYTNDEKFYRDFLETFEPLIRHGVEPLPGYADQILNSSDVFVTKLRRGKYKFKVFLYTAGDYEVQKNQISTYPPIILIRMELLSILVLSDLHSN